MTAREKALAVALLPVWLIAASGWAFWVAFGLGVQGVLPR